jgi:hypothetical protein
MKYFHVLRGMAFRTGMQVTQQRVPSDGRSTHIHIGFAIKVDSSSALRLLLLLLLLLPRV